TNSDKPLNAKRARQILARELPAFGGTVGPLVIKTSEGYRASRSLESVAGCSFHYVWEDASAAEALFSAGPLIAVARRTLPCASSVTSTTTSPRICIPG